LTFQFGSKLQHGAAERTWLRAEVKGEDCGARKSIVIAPFMRKRDQLLWWAGGNSVPRQQPQELVILRVSVSYRSRHEYRGRGEGGNKCADSHG
jgi:hypothetical protein